MVSLLLYNIWTDNYMYREHQHLYVRILGNTVAKYKLQWYETLKFA